MHTGITSKKIVVEGNYWFTSLFYSLISCVSDSIILSIDRQNEFADDMFGNNLYFSSAEDFNKENTARNISLCNIINCSSSVESKKIVKMLEEIDHVIVNHKNLLSFFEQIDKKHESVKRLKGLNVDSDIKRSYLFFLEIPEDIIQKNTQIFSLNFELNNNVNFYDDKNNMSFYAKLKNAKLNFLVKSLLDTTDEVSAEAYIQQNFGKTFSNKHISYATKNSIKNKSSMEELIVILMIICYRSRFYCDKTWFNLLFILITILSNKEKLDIDERVKAKKIIKKIIAEKFYV